MFKIIELYIVKKQHSISAMEGEGGGYKWKIKKKKKNTNAYNIHNIDQVEIGCLGHFYVCRWA